jgi:hypothetical protein
MLVGLVFQLPTNNIFLSLQISINHANHQPTNGTKGGGLAYTSTGASR